MHLLSVFSLRNRALIALLTIVVAVFGNTEAGRDAVALGVQLARARHAQLILGARWVRRSVAVALPTTASCARRSS